MEKLKYPYSTGCLTEKPFRSIFLIIKVILADLFKFEINYKAVVKKSKFNYNYTPYPTSGLGGRGQYILREYYDKFFFVGHDVLPNKFNFIDIGCSRGFFSLYLLGLQNFKGMGLGIDPLSKAIEDFKKILKLKKKKKMNLINGIISNKKTLKMPIYKVSRLGYFSIIKNISFADKLPKGKSPESFLTRSYKLDDLVKKKKLIKEVKFIKIDAEGAEYEILCSAKETIKKYKPIFYCEVTRKRKEICSFFKKKNYILFNFNQKKLNKIEPKSFYGGELLAIHKSDNYFSKNTMQLKKFY